MQDDKDSYYIEQVKKGNGAAYAALVDKYKDYAFTVAVRILKQREDAEEVAQDAFIKAYGKIGDFKGEAKFSTWLYRIVCNTALSKVRKTKPDITEINEEITENFESGVENQFAALHNRDQKRYLKAAIERLDETDGLMLTLYYLNDQSVKEIAEITDLNNSNVKVRLLRSRKKLYHELQLLLKNEMKSLL